MNEKELNKQKPSSEANDEVQDETLDSVTGGSLPQYHRERPESTGPKWSRVERTSDGD